MVSNSRFHDLFEGIIDSSSHPAVDVNALHAKPDLLLCEVLILDVMQHLSEDGALFPPVVLGSVLVAVCG